MSRGVWWPQPSAGSSSTLTRHSNKVVGRYITFLLCTRNVERFLFERLVWLERQTFKNWKLIASDDRSSDRRKSILLVFQRSFEPGRVDIIDGPRRRAAANFLVLAGCENLVGDYGLWDADKFERAISATGRIDPCIAGHLRSPARLIDQAGNDIGFSRTESGGPKRAGAKHRSSRTTRARHLLRRGCGALARLVALPGHSRLLTLRRAIVSMRQTLLAAMWASPLAGAVFRCSGKGVFATGRSLACGALPRLRPKISAENQNIFDSFCETRRRLLLKRVRLFAQTLRSHGGRCAEQDLTQLPRVLFVSSGAIVLLITGAAATSGPLSSTPGLTR